MNIDFANKVVLVAGGTGGLGRAVSQAFLREDAKVVVTYRNHHEFAGLQRSTATKVSLLEGYLVDVTDEAEVGKFISQVIAIHGRVDAMVNTVGGYAGGVKLWNLDTAVFDRMLAMNLRAGYALSRAVIAPMLKQKSGAIVNVASKASFDHASGAAAYAASKAAALAMIDSLAEDVRGSGVRVNSVLPSIIDTETNRKAMPNADYRTWPKPEDIARTILFLCSEEAKVIHGAAIPVYGNR